MSDIKEILRNAADDPLVTAYMSEDDLIRAANRIERLEAENAKLLKALQLFDPGQNSLNCAAQEQSDED